MSIYMNVHSPHLGSWGVPFMNRMQREEPVSLFSLTFKS